MPINKAIMLWATGGVTSLKRSSFSSPINLLLTDWNLQITKKDSTMKALIKQDENRYSYVRSKTHCTLTAQEHQ